MWVQLPEGADTWAALDPAVEAGVKYNPGPLFRAQRDRSNYLRLTYSHQLAGGDTRRCLDPGGRLPARGPLQRRLGAESPLSQAWERG